MGLNHSSLYHIKKQHQHNQSIKCKYCNTLFSSKKNFKKHLTFNNKCLFYFTPIIYNNNNEKL